MGLLTRKRKPKFTDRELIAIRTLSGIYLSGIEKNDNNDETMKLVKETLQSVKSKVEAADIKDIVPRSSNKCN